MFPSTFSRLALLPLLGLSACQALRPFDSANRPAEFAYDPLYSIRKLEVENFEGYAAAQQESVWCWAACAAMVSDYYANLGRAREPLGQEEAARKQAEIVQRIRRRSEGQPSAEDAASKSEVLGALKVELYEQLLATEERVQLHVAQSLVDALMSDSDEADTRTAAALPASMEPEPRPPHLGFDAERLYRELRDDSGRGANPVIAALLGEQGTGHVVIVTGACYQEIPRPTATDPTVEPDVEHRLMTVRIWDPTKDLPGACETYGGESWLAASEFAARCDFMASRTSAEAYLAYLEEHARWAERAFAPLASTVP